jgi:acyl-CoA thioesterase FadM
MFGLLRLFGVTLRSRFRPRRSLLETSVLRLRVWPTDLDLNLHLNNARYLGLMDLGRVDVLVSGGLGFWGQGGRQPLVAASFCRYFKPLGPFQAFELHTRLAGFDEKWCYFEQRFVAQGRLHALAVVKGLLVSQGRPVPTADLLVVAGQTPLQSPALPAWIREWLRAEREAIESLKAEARTSA